MYVIIYVHNCMFWDSDKKYQEAGGKNTIHKFRIVTKQIWVPLLHFHLCLLPELFRLRRLSRCFARNCTDRKMEAKGVTSTGRTGTPTLSWMTQVEISNTFKYTDIFGWIRFTWGVVGQTTHSWATIHTGGDHVFWHPKNSTQDSISKWHQCQRQQPSKFQSPKLFVLVLQRALLLVKPLPDVMRIGSHRIVHPLGVEISQKVWAFGYLFWGGGRWMGGLLETDHRWVFHFPNWEGFKRASGGIMVIAASP